jgi:GntP family gluconate:H+ symporter
MRESAESMKALEALAKADARQLPPTWLALMPIVLPVVLLAVAPLIQPPAHAQGLTRRVLGLLAALGDKNLALALGAAIGMGTMFWKTSAGRLGAGVKTALASAGIIILITSAGGAFGTVLQQTGIAGAIEGIARDYQVAVLPLAFLLTVAIRTAQGSATVAMLTAAGVFAGMADAVQLGFHPLYLALAIGCGSKPIWWMNDSGFWVVTQMSGMTETEGLRTLTPMAALMGVAGLLVTIAGARLFPLV